MNVPFSTRTRGESRLLLDLHRFEETRIAGPGSSRRDIRDVLWTIDEAISSIGMEGDEIADFNSLLEHMRAHGQLMTVPDFSDGEAGHITRMAETIRLLGHTYEYWHQGRPGADAIRWLPVAKLIPDRNITHSEFSERLDSDLSDFYSNAGGDDLRTAVSEVVEGVSSGLGGSAGASGARYSEFQYRSTRDMLVSSLGSEPRIQVLTAGVGSGKTIGFLMATLILSRLSELRGSWEVDLVLYPRTALAQDQFNTLKALASDAELDPSAVHSEMSQYYDKGLGTSVKKGVRAVHGGAGGPLVVVCTMETLKRRLQNPDFVRGIMPRLRRVIIDEVHLVNGSQGAHVATLMRRLRELSGRHLQWTASSATIAAPEEHASRLFDVDHRLVDVISPEDPELVIDGVQNHVFVRPSGRISKLGLLVNMTSVVVHGMRDDISDKPNTDRQIEAAPKAIGFADNLDMLGRWNSDLMENERTENRERSDGYERPHPVHEDPVSTGAHRWSRQQREIPYASRMLNTLDRRISSEGGVLPAEDGGGPALLPVLQEHRGRNLCGSCRGGNRISLGPADAETMEELGKHVHRIEHDPDDPFKPFLIDHEVFRTEQEEIGTMDLCPYLRSGSCTWFSNSDPGSTSMIPGTDNNPRYEFSSVARSSIFSSKSERSGEEEGLSSTVFKDSLENVYQLGGRRTTIPVDIVLASPSLEVGIDLPYLTESVMVNSIRNIASYRQKAGRVGRETNLDTLNATLVTDSPVDLHYYRQPRKLVMEGRLEPVPLKERNRSIVLCGLYQSIWDWLALNSSLPEIIPTGWEVAAEISQFRRDLEGCISDIEQRRGEIARHLSAICGAMFPPSSSQIQEAIDQASDEIGAFLRPAADTKVFGRPLLGDYTVADVLSRRLSSNDTAETPRSIRRDVSMFIASNDNHWSNLKTSRRDLANLEGRGRINVEALENLDRLFRCEVPDLESLRTIGEQLRANLDAMDAGPSHRKLTRFMNNFDRIFDNLDLLVSDDGWDPLAHQMIAQFDRLLEEASWKATYFSTVRQNLRCLRFLQRADWYIEPSTFFKNPYDLEVELCGNLPESQKFISVSESLHSFIPGTFTYRLPQGCYKVLCRGQEPTPLNTSYVNRQRLEERGSQFRLSSEGVPGPPGIQDGTFLDIYTPVKLWLKREPRKYILLNPEEGLLVDGDDMTNPRTSGRESRIKVPRTFNNRWTHVEDQVGESLGMPDPADSELGKLIVKSGDEDIEGQEAADLVKHPMMDNHIFSARWHDNLQVTEYVYSSTRTFTTDSGYGAEVRFRDEIGNIGWGEKLETEGISLDLDHRSVRDTILRITEESAGTSGHWTPTVLKAFSSFLSGMSLDDEGNTLGHFEIQDLIALIIATAEDGDAPLNQTTVVELALGMADDRERLRALVRRRVLALSGDSDPEGDPDLTRRQADQDDLENSIAAKIALVNSMRAALLDRSAEFADDFYPLWIHRSILMGLGISSVSSLQRVAGSQTSDVGYAIDPESWNGSGHSVHIYDRSHYGNGNCRVAKDFLFIPNLLRHRMNKRSKMLPSSDFLSGLEESMLQCMQHHSDMSALSLHSTGGDPTPLSMALNDVEDHARETLGVATDAWSSMGISGTSDAWKVPLKFLIRKELSEESGIPLDDFTRSTKFCWNGCPECIDRMDVVLGGVYGMQYLDKAVLDTWYQQGRSASQEYHDLPLESVASGTSDLQLGVLHNVSVDIENRRIRSSLLPWTIGLHIERGQPEEGASIVIRESDISGHRLIDAPGQSVIMGTPSVGIKRLLWWDLMITAFLDGAGKLGDAERRIDLVYYDIRDIAFEDSGLTPRMMDAITSMGRENGFDRFETLSDVLAWMAFRGFEIRVCVDSGRAEEEGVRDFLSRLRSRTQDSPGEVQILSKSVPVASMHKKILLTPVWGMMGTANMTYSGTGSSEEIEAHVLASDPNYVQLKQSCEDSLVGAVEWGG